MVSPRIGVAQESAIGSVQKRGRPQSQPSAAIAAVAPCRAPLAGPGCAVSWHAIDPTRDLDQSYNRAQPWSVGLLVEILVRLERSSART